MMLEEVIRYAIDGLALDPNLTDRTMATAIQQLIDVLIDYPSDTDKDLRDILAGYKSE